jgi:hypothetical protein
MEHQYFNGIKFYEDKKAGYWISTTNPRKRMHIVVWEFHNGKIPDKYHVHHVDENKSNNDILNLRLISEKDHLSMHMTDERREFSREWVSRIRPLTKEWHASEEGRKWHREHGIKGWKNRKPMLVVCRKCGESFSTKTYHNTFCSNACKSSWRRAQKTDDIDATCRFCGKIFRKNKYADTTSCSGTCAAKLRWRQRNKENRQTECLLSCNKKQ